MALAKEGAMEFEVQLPKLAPQSAFGARGGSGCAQHGRAPTKEPRSMPLTPLIQTSLATVRLSCVEQLNCFAH